MSCIAVGSNAAATRQLCICVAQMRFGAANDSFGGMYFMKDRACVGPNALTGQCSCSAAYALAGPYDLGLVYAVYAGSAVAIAPAYRCGAPDDGRAPATCACRRPERWPAKPHSRAFIRASRGASARSATRSMAASVRAPRAWSAHPA